LFYYLM